MEYKFRPGGLVRCCTLTLSMYHEPPSVTEVEQGTQLPCRYCSTTMIYIDDAWERDKSAKSKYGDVPVPTEAELA